LKREGSAPCWNREDGSMNRIQDLIDDGGNRTAAVIPLEGNEAAVEDFLEDLYGSEMIRQRRNRETMSKDDLLKELRDDGLL